MMHIVIIEQHLLLRLGLASLMACLVTSDRIKSQSHDDLYRSEPHGTATSLVLLGAHSEDRINLLIQAVRRIHAPKRILLLSDTPTCPASWGTLPPLVAGYLSRNANGQVILSAAQSLINRYAGHGGVSRAGTMASLISGASVGSSSSYSPLVQSEENEDLAFPVNEASMLGLSTRQYEVLVLLAQGLPIKLICRQLAISMATTKGHIEAVYQRLNAHNRNEAVFVAMARGAKLKMNNAHEKRKRREF